MLLLVATGEAGAASVPLRYRELQELTTPPDALWRAIGVVPQTASTNQDLMQLARDSDQDGVALLAEYQSQGRGRLARSWVAPPGSSLIVSVLLRPSLPVVSWGWIPLLTGLAVCDALREVCGLGPALKWPNDVLLCASGQRRKVCGILVEVAGAPVVDVPAQQGVSQEQHRFSLEQQRFLPAVVIGAGINVTQQQSDLPVPEATSLALAGAPNVDRTHLACAYLSHLERRYRDYCAANGNPHHSGLWHDYTQACQTIGQRVTMHCAGRQLHGEVVGVDDGGQLLLCTASGTQAVAAGEVSQVRQS